MPTRQALHQIVEELPEESLGPAAQLLVKLRDGVTEPDLSPEEATESEDAWRAYLRGEDPGESLEKIRRELLG